MYVNYVQASKVGCSKIINFHVFEKGIKNVAVYGPYKVAKVIGILEAFPLKCHAFLYIQRKFQKIQRKIQPDLELTKQNICMRF